MCYNRLNRLQKNGGFIMKSNNLKRAAVLGLATIMLVPSAKNLRMSKKTINMLGLTMQLMY